MMRRVVHSAQSYPVLITTVNTLGLYRLIPHILDIPARWRTIIRASWWTITTTIGWPEGQTTLRNTPHT